ncbi:MAG TPA: GNAT family N-acetyltransferase [Myxococcota bacterium]|nr:GNAT family N-acetyltransferase [Myxococcota bacterium]
MAQSAIVAVIDFEERYRQECASVIHQLADWFGIEASNQAYIAALGRLPTFLVHDEERVLGFIALEETSVEAVEIHVMAVAPDRHRSGIGRAMVSRAEGWMRFRGLRILHVKTLGPSHPDPYYARTRAFYQALGFRPVFETTALWGAENPSLVLVKLIAGVTRGPGAHGTNPPREAPRASGGRCGAKHR